MSTPLSRVALLAALLGSSSLGCAAAGEDGMLTFIPDAQTDRPPSPTEDSSTALPDSSGPSVDAGTDSGAPDDTGRPPSDTGFAPLDTGFAPVDTGSVPMDTGALPPDRPAPVDVPPRDVGGGGGLCARCATNDDCATGGYCLTNQRTGEMICGVSCAGGCPSGFACANITVPMGMLQQCVPTGGTCTPPADSGVPIDTGSPADTGAVPVDVGPPPADTGALTPGTRTITLGTRSALLYVPTSWSPGGPGLVALHGNGDSAANFLATSGLRAVADAQGVALALPVAIPGSYMGVDWNAYTRPATSNPDIVLTRAARAHLVGAGVDPRRVFLLGYSQGGYLAYHVAMAASTEFGAVNVSAAGDPMPGARLSSSAARRIPVDLLIGTLDSALSNTRSTRDELLEVGFDVRYTELPGVGHCCPLSTTTGQAPRVWSWLSARPIP